MKRGRNKSLSNDSSAKILYIVGEQYDDNVGCCGCKWKISAERLQRIHKERDFEGSIFLLDRRTCVGRVGRHWGTVDSLICDPSIVNDCYGVQVKFIEMRLVFQFCMRVNYFFLVSIQSGSQNKMCLVRSPFFSGN